MVQNLCKIHQKPLILGTSKTVYTHGRQTRGKKLPVDKGHSKQKCMGKASEPITCQQLLAGGCYKIPWQPHMFGSEWIRWWGSCRHRLGPMMGSRTWSVRNILLWELLHGVRNHVSPWLWLSLKKTQKGSVALSSMSNTASSPGLTLGDHIFTRWVFVRHKEYSNKSLQRDNHHDQASPAGFSCAQCPCSLNCPAKSRAPQFPLRMPLA